MIRLPHPVSANRYWRTYGGRVVRSAEAESYKREAAYWAYVAGVRQIDGPVSVSLTYHPRRTKQGRASQTRPDIDNIVKVTLDALNGVAYADDKQVVRLSVDIGEPECGGGLTVRVDAV